MLLADSTSLELSPSDWVEALRLEDEDLVPLMMTDFNSLYISYLEKIEISSLATEAQFKVSNIYVEKAW